MAFNTSMEVLAFYVWQLEVETGDVYGCNTKEKGRIHGVGMSKNPLNRKN